MADDQRNKPPSDEQLQTALAALAEIHKVKRKELDVRELEEKNRGKEIDLQEKALKYQQEYALQALDAHSEDRKDERRDRAGERNKVLILQGLLLVLIGAILSIAAYRDRWDVVMSVSQVLVGIAGGFGWGFYKGKKSGQSEPDSDPPEAD